MLDRNMKWIVEPGWFRVMIGSSSDDIRQEGRFEILTTDRIDKPYDNSDLKR
jgi:beta-glucosidase